MADNRVSSEKLKQKLSEKAKSAPTPPAGGGSMSGERNDPRGEGTEDKDAAAGPKSMPEKQVAAEEIIRRAKAEDVEDTREETSGTERHDLVIPSHPNIPPTIVSERLRLGQNPTTGEPWTREERLKYDRDVEQDRQNHARAVRESEEKMRREQADAANQTPIQPTPHVPVSQLTEGQKKAMQKAQDEGKGAIAQAAARDQNSPDAIGRREAEANLMTDQEKRRQDVGVDEDIEKKELGEDDEPVTDEEVIEGDKDADQVEADLKRR